MLELDNISKSIPEPAGGSFEIIRSISLTLKEAEIVCILGASGCGKSTLLKIVAGLETQTSGTLSSEIKVPGEFLGYLPQGERLLGWRNVLDNIALSAELIGCSKKEARNRASQRLKEVGLEDFKNKKPREISGGMTQRVLIARLFATNPKLILLDEPLGQLDLIGRRFLASKIKEYVRREKAGAVVVTHSVDEAVFLADRIYVLSPRPAVIKKIFSFSEASSQDVEGLDREHAFDRVFSETSRILELG